MERATLALCDWESRFVRNFLDHYTVKGRDVFDIKVFTDEERCLSYAREHRIDVLLISDSLLSEEMESLGIEKIIILSEGSVSRKFSDYPVIYKYQSSERIITQVLDIYADCVREDMGTYCTGRGLRIIGVYSPVRRVGKTSLALSLGQLLAKDKKVLYLNMEEYSGLNGILEGNYKGDLLDAIFYQRQKSGNMRYKISGMTCRLNGMEYIYPALYSEDLKSVTASEWLEFISTIEEQTDYSVLILDMGDTVEGLSAIMEKCSVIYMPERHDFFSQGKIMQFEEYMRNTQKDWVLDKVIKVEVPEIMGAGNAQDYLNALGNGSFAGSIRGLCVEEYCNAYV
ncbi:MAG: hypothetical protein IK152_09410 [Lachnospiraceae bacterium]|nr:hypothetical protein [Lachnospiraceae bacterium]